MALQGLLLQLGAKETFSNLIFNPTQEIICASSLFFSLRPHLLHLTGEKITCIYCSTSFSDTEVKRLKLALTARDTTEK